MSGYPLRLEGHLDAPGRWLWLVKWVLIIPHAFVLLFLFIAGFFATVGAFFAILFTGRYPRGLFDFNVGVLRWTWRVTYWSYGALGTDRYPPFTLDDVPDYPARLDVAYPEELSRGLVLVKWWLLAIPQFIVVGVLQNVNGVLVFVAGVILLFTGRYPQGIYDLVMGINRWGFRVNAYVGLMTDKYPPFSLDMGDTEGPLPSGPEHPGIGGTPAPA
jgi:Domain of unknown function (DUF4389)